MAKAKKPQRLLHCQLHYLPDRYERQKLLQVYRLLVPVPSPPVSRCPLPLLKKSPR